MTFIWILLFGQCIISATATTNFLRSIRSIIVGSRSSDRSRGNNYSQNWNTYIRSGIVYYYQSDTIVRYSVPEYCGGHHNCVRSIVWFVPRRSDRYHRTHIVRRHPVGQRCSGGALWGSPSGSFPTPHKHPGDWLDTGPLNNKIPVTCGLYPP